MFLTLIKLVSSNFGPCTFYLFILIQTFAKVLVLFPTVSLHPLNDDVDDGEPRHHFYVAF